MAMFTKEVNPNANPIQTTTARTNPGTPRMPANESGHTNTGPTSSGTVRANPGASQAFEAKHPAEQFNIPATTVPSPTTPSTNADTSNSVPNPVPNPVPNHVPTLANMHAANDAYRKVYALGCALELVDGRIRILGKPEAIDAARPIVIAHKTGLMKMITPGVNGVDGCVVVEFKRHASRDTQSEAVIADPPPSELLARENISDSQWHAITWLIGVGSRLQSKVQAAKENASLASTNGPAANGSLNAEAPSDAPPTVVDFGRVREGSGQDNGERPGAFGPWFPVESAARQLFGLVLRWDTLDAAARKMTAEKIEAFWRAATGGDGGGKDAIDGGIASGSGKVVSRNWRTMDRYEWAGGGHE